MKGEMWIQWLRLFMVMQLFVLLPTLAATLQCQVKNYTYSCNTLEKVLDLPWEGGRKVCVIPQSENAKLKVRYTDIFGHKQEVVVRKKSLTPDTLVVLDINVEMENSKDRLLVRINGTNLQQNNHAPSDNQRPNQNQLPRTTLLLKGDAKIMPCTLAQEREEAGSELNDKAGGKEEVTSASLTPLMDNATTIKSTDTQDPEDEPWWSFVEVLGMVGPVPVLVLLVICLLVGILVGCILVCLCSKACQKRYVEYVSVSANPGKADSTSPNTVTNPSQSDTLESCGSSGIGSASSTLRTATSRDTIDISPNNTTQLNNLGAGVQRSTEFASIRKNPSSGRILNIPNNPSVSRSNSNRSTERNNEIISRGPSHTRTTKEMTGDKPVNTTTSNSINRNVNRRPIIPYTIDLENIPSQESPFLQDWAPPKDPNDPNYDLPYDSSSPLLCNGRTRLGSVELTTMRVSSDDPQHEKFQ